ncbi:hypothetical protein FK178_09750 [Antarcticibacterium arcticum]|uniref:Uncharacterized protein n=1 Tax=Antarcticibacterium arcticum TaxID=2585771 RepID=A0A5B8YJ66_9FLAO|nr:hypothetical protein [Antarcticibacterium arcticum]QED37992.1 hypothetical protein FK178_09750 [Antarcticibacterium arcticum]
MQTYNKIDNTPMLSKAILELNGVFNIRKKRLQPPQTGSLQNTIRTVATEHLEYVDPILTTEDFKSSMENYRKVVDAYNIKVKEENILITTYNKRIKKAIDTQPLTRQEQKILIKFNNMIAPLNTWERNERVDSFNGCNRPMAQKDKIHTIKYHTEQIFSAILWHYNKQLYKRKAIRHQLEVYIPGKLPYIELHTGWITTAKVNDVVRLNVCQKTFRRQRKRLEEAGILQDYIFEGSSRPVKMRINPEILSITDNFAGKNPATENQHTTPTQRTVLPHNKVSNRTVLNNLKIKANVDKHSDIRSSAPGLTSSTFSFYKTTRKQVEEKVDAGPKNLTLSDFLGEKIDDPADFVENLAAHRYDKYTPLRIEILEKEAFAGALDRDQYKELVLQDFFKTAAKLWKGKSPYPGSWTKAYNTWKNEKFITHSGDSSNKYVVLQRVAELRYRVTGVSRFLKNHPDFNLLYPGDYFDVTRTTAKEGGFEYTEKMWKKHIAYLETKKEEKQKTVATASKRKKRLTDRQKVDNHVKAYLKGKFYLEELLTKVEQLGNKELYRNLPEIIKKANLNFQLKNGK